MASPPTTSPTIAPADASRAVSCARPLGSIQGPPAAGGAGGAPKAPVPAASVSAPRAVSGWAGRGGRWLVGAAAIALLGTAGARWSGVFQGLWGGSRSGSHVHVVQPMELVITLAEDGELKPRESIEIRNEVEGASTVLFIVPESTRVSAGDLLVELASDELKERYEQEMISLKTTEAAKQAAEQELEITQNENASKLRKAEIDLAVAELELDQYLKGDYEQKRRAAEIEIQQTKMDLERKRDELAKNRRLREKDYVTQSKIDQLALEVTKLEMTLEKNELALRILEEYERPKMEKQKSAARDQAREELEREEQRARSRLAQAAAKLEEQTANLDVRKRRVERLSRLLGKTRIVAPVDGVVRYADAENMWRSGGEMIAVGQKVYEGQTLVVLPNTEQMLVSTRIHEGDRHQIRVGLPVEVRVPAVPGRVFSGTLSKVAAFADSANRWFNPQLKEHAAEVLLDATDAPLSPGDSAELKILIDRIPQALAVPVQCVFARGDRTFVFVERGLSAAPVEVRLGRSSTEMIEVLDGLAPGDRVLLHADARLLAMLPEARDAAPEAGADLPQAAGPRGPASANPRRDGGARQAKPGGGT